MDRKRKIKQIAQDVREIRDDINAHVGKENTMNNEEVVPAATENVTPATEENPHEPQVEVVVDRDPVEEEINAFNQHEAEEAAQLQELERLRGLSEEELTAEGVPTTRVPRNAATSEPDLDPETARELERRAAASPTNSFEADSGADSTDTDEEIVG